MGSKRVVSEIRVEHVALTGNPVGPTWLSINQKGHQVVGVVLVPGVDETGDQISEDLIAKTAIEWYKQSSRPFVLEHEAPGGGKPTLVNLTELGFGVAPMPSHLEKADHVTLYPSGAEVPCGAWFVELGIPDSLWHAVESGRLNGLSIQGSARFAKGESDADDEWFDLADENVVKRLLAKVAYELESHVPCWGSPKWRT